jgi:glycosyltransferase involved in cell wall biosynthesis
MGFKLSKGIKAEFRIFNSNRIRKLDEDATGSGSRNELAKANRLGYDVPARGHLLIPMSKDAPNAKFVVATPQRSVCDSNARVLEKRGQLRFIALGTRRGAAGVQPERTRLNPWIGLWAYAAARALPVYRAEAFRIRLLPWFDRWVLKQLQPGDHIISSYGYTNRCFGFVRRNGGNTFLDAGNSHIENYWATVSEEHRRWNCSYPPFTPYWYKRARAMLDNVDYVLSPSSYVTQSFLERGFKPEQILRNVYPVDLSVFQPQTTPRPKDRPLTVINTGSLCLRKGTPYLLEAFRMVRKSVPNARLLLTNVIREDVRPILGQCQDLPIEWSPGLPHPALAERLRGGDVFVLLSVEEGLVRSALEAMACGLQVVLTPNTGANDFVKPGVNGEVVPIRDAQAAARAILACWERVQQGAVTDVRDLHRRLSFETFERDFLAQLEAIGLLKV